MDTTRRRLDWMKRRRAARAAAAVAFAFGALALAAGSLVTPRDVGAAFFAGLAATGFLAGALDLGGVDFFAGRDMRDVRAPSSPVYGRPRAGVAGISPP